MDIPTSITVVYPSLVTAARRNEPAVIKFPGRNLISNNSDFFEGKALVKVIVRGKHNFRLMKNMGKHTLMAVNNY